jgi:hypothetical protein
MCNIDILKQDYRVAKKGGGRGRELTIKIPCKLPGRAQLVYDKHNDNDKAYKVPGLKKFP